MWREAGTSIKIVFLACYTPAPDTAPPTSWFHSKSSAEIFYGSAHAEMVSRISFVK
jgi:hypothetical protein